ncbi:MAG TPA: PilC/PilY family type IV pilus protein [Burkholderiales bacterium]|jgi:type IV pilus assembly protein PilY1
MMRKLARYLSMGALALCACSAAQAQTQFNLASQPLNVANNIAPNVLFALSVEFPTAITPAYNWSTSTTTTSGPYLAGNAYLGYFDSGKCYDYNQSSTSGAAGTYTAANAAARYFVPVSTTSDHTCGGNHWSGNFMNWVAMAGLDEFRFAMTGGNRIVDTASLTVLQRTWQTNQGSNFAEKQLTGSALIKGATPLTTSGTWYFYSSGKDVQMNFGKTQNSPDNSVYVQVQVCNSTIQVESNCTAYTDNASGVVTYKPTGAVQNNSDTMRFGVLSYFNSNSTENAVLRAKMKFTGQYKYDASGVQTANTFKEWSPTTGIFTSNPDSGDGAITTAVAGANSGVVNYVNQFGMVSQSYKTFDNVGKLYYEALAYLRKRTLDSNFYTQAATSNADGFPVISAYTEDPIQAYCQKNFIFVMGDTHTHCDRRLPGGAYPASPVSGIPAQCRGKNTSGTSNSANPNYDDTGSLSNGDTINVDNLTGLIGSSLKAPTGTGSGGAASFYMAGLAFWAHTNDIRPDLNTGASTNKTTVTTYIVDVQEAQDQGVNSQYWYAAKYGGFDTSTGATTPSSAAGTTSNWSAYDATYDGNCTKVNGGGCSGPASNDGSSSATHGVRPKSYLPAGNPLAMITAVNSAFSQISAATKSDAAVTSSSGNLSLTGSVYQYQSAFTSVSWVGDLSAFLVTAVTSGITVSNGSDWKASDKLNAGNPSATARVVLSYNDGVAGTYASSATSTQTNGLSRKGIAFSALADLSAAQQAALGVSTAGVADSLGSNRINYIRGSRADELPASSGCTGGGGGSGGFRCRSAGMLGDIVHSQPAVVSDPLDTDFSISDPLPTNPLFQTGYVSFATSTSSRTPAVYVGANDGMLHGFNADSTDATNKGKEILAYVPSPVVRNLNKLTSPSYAHAYYVDASPRVASACPATAGCTGSSSWKSVLVSGLGAGGQGIFALDVTNPSFSQPGAGTPSSTVMWEFTDRNDADMGYFLGKPLIAKMNNGKWAAIFGNGYNNTASDGAASTTGRGYLYIVFLSGPPTAGSNWTVGTDYIKLLAGTGTASTTPGSTAVPNGLGSPVAIDADLDGAIDYIYAGDVYGNVWKFNVKDATPGTWATAFGGAPLFSARDATGNVQPITAGLAISFSPAGGFLLNFGTGQYLSTADPNTTSQQSYYGVLDVNDNSTKPPVTAITSPVTAPGFRSSGTLNSLQKQQVILAGYFTGSAALQNTSGITQNATNNCAGIPTGATCVTVQSDCRVNFPGLNLTTTLNTDATSCPAAVTNPPVQLGWYFDFPNSAEREVEDRPIALGSVIEFTSLVPSGAACSGGLTGYPYILDSNTGGRPGATVFDITGSGIANAAQMFPVGGVNYVISGISLPAGATVNTPAIYQLPERGINGGAGSSSGTKFSSGTSAPVDTATTPLSKRGCSTDATFIPGWGCVGVPESSSTAAALGSGSASVGLFLPGQTNRLYWRQLFTQ